MLNFLGIEMFSCTLHHSDTNIIMDTESDQSTEKTLGVYRNLNEDNSKLLTMGGQSDRN